MNDTGAADEVHVGVFWRMPALLYVVESLAVEPSPSSNFQ
jgi:hypothetical protein